MKRKGLLLLFGLTLMLSAPALAQVNINVHTGKPVYRQPIYQEVADYYYLPDYGVYYNVPRKVYVYQERGQWVYARRLPKRYGYHHDWRRTHFVRMHERAPFLRNDYYHRRYGKAYAKPYQHKYKHYDRQHRYERRDRDDYRKGPRYYKNDHRADRDRGYRHRDRD